MQKIDLHVHCAPQRRKSPIINTRDPEDNYIADPVELRSHLEAQGIRRAVIMSGGEETGAEGLFTNNRECFDIAQAHPDFFAWMCNFQPVDPASIYDRMASAKRMGAIGVGELAVNEWLDSPFLTELFSAAEKLELPVTMHMSPEPGFSYGVCDKSGLPLLERTLQRFPNLKLLGHSQLFWLEISADCPKTGNQERSAMGRGPIKPGGRIEQLMRKYSNFYGDLSAYSGTRAIMRDEAYGVAFLEEFSDRKSVV